jgi:putative transposase
VLPDACSRRAVGWAMADRPRTESAPAALAMARRRRPGPGPVHHTDRGCRYTAAGYRQVPTAHGLAPSTSRAGDRCDNALAEGFVATPKGGPVDRRAWPTRQTARQAIFGWIGVFYNRRRLHSALAYRAPVAFAERMVLMPQAA